jgi:hypothetical protein
VLDQLQTEGYPVPEEDLAHLPPARFEKEAMNRLEASLHQPAFW